MYRLMPPTDLLKEVSGLIMALHQGLPRFVIIAISNDSTLPRATLPDIRLQIHTGVLQLLDIIQGDFQE